MWQKILGIFSGLFAFFFYRKAKKEAARADRAEKQVEQHKNIDKLQEKMTNIAGSEDEPLEIKDRHVKGRDDSDIFGNSDWS